MHGKHSIKEGRNFHICCHVIAITAQEKWVLLLQMGKMRLRKVKVLAQGHTLVVKLRFRFRSGSLGSIALANCHSTIVRPLVFTSALVPWFTLDMGISLLPSQTLGSFRARFFKRHHSAFIE